jgi:hypothetical protein
MIDPPAKGSSRRHRSIPRILFQHGPFPCNRFLSAVLFSAPGLLNVLFTSIRPALLRTSTDPPMEPRFDLKTLFLLDEGRPDGGKQGFF